MAAISGTDSRAEILYISHIDFFHFSPSPLSIVFSSLFFLFIFLFLFR